MSDAERLAGLAGLLADRTRAGFCLALLDGRAWTPGELARRGGVAASTATEHLHRMVAGGLLIEHRQGRHRYVQLADPQVAALVEEMLALTGPPPQPTGTLRASRVAAAMARARTCYDHFAGELGVGVTDALVRHGYLDRDSGFALTDAGRAWFADELKADLAVPGRRPVVRACLDWTQRRPHLAGVAGAALCQRFQDEGWVVRIGSERAVRITPAGSDALLRLLDVTLFDVTP